MKKTLISLLLSTTIFATTPLPVLAEESSLDHTETESSTPQELTEEPNNKTSSEGTEKKQPELNANDTNQINQDSSEQQREASTSSTDTETNSSTYNELTPISANEVTIPDPAFKSILTAELGLKETDPITEDDMLKLSNLSFNRYPALANEITSLEGLQYATNLTSLTITGTNITSVSQISSLTNLTELTISRTNVSDISSVAPLINLNMLYLTDTKVADISPVTSLTNLKSLLLPVNKISDVSPIKNLTQLTVLNLNDNMVSDLLPLQNLTNLEALYLAGNRITLLDGLETLVNLETLQLDATTNLSVGGSGDGSNRNDISDLSPLSTLTKLKTLTLSGYGASISDISPLATLIHLNDLRFFENNVSDISSLKNLTQLTYLQISGQPLDNIEVVRNFPNLAYLDISDTHTSDITPIRNLTKLNNLQASENNISSVDSLSLLTNLTWLDLAFNKISDISPMENVTKLNRLLLQNNQITDIQVLSQIKSFIYLDISANHISDISSLENTEITSRFAAFDQTINLPTISMNVATPIEIKSKNGSIPTLTWTNLGTYTDGKLKWQNIGNNQLTFAATDSNFTGTVTQTVTEPISDGEVIVKHVDENGKELIPSITLTGPIGEAFQTKEETIAGYSLKTAPKVNSGKFTAATQTFTYIYQKDPVPGETVTVKYVDENGTVLAPEQILTGNIGEAYQTTSLDIDGYVLTKTPDNARGEFTNQKQEVIYIYEKSAVVGQSVTVFYKDQDGNEIASSEVLNGMVGESYQTSAKDILGYKLTQTPDNATGTFTDVAQTVTYIYEKELDIPVIPTPEPENPGLITDPTIPGLALPTQPKDHAKNKSTLPNTGEANLFVNTLLGSLLTVFGLTYFLQRKKHHKA